MTHILFTRWSPFSTPLFHTHTHRPLYTHRHTHAHSDLNASYFTWANMRTSPRKRIWHPDQSDCNKDIGVAGLRVGIGRQNMTYWSIGWLGKPCHLSGVVLRGHSITAQMKNLWQVKVSLWELVNLSLRELVKVGLWELVNVSLWELVNVGMPGLTSTSYLNTWVRAAGQGYTLIHLSCVCTCVCDQAGLVSEGMAGLEIDTTWLLPPEA